ncbi:hypothetical protein D0962_37130 [Leptolyngbyaceae cyanobacterium CCMR0082]|uniref:Uncharacterized protein n=1 Tax=Adonisia turfae CCMR0082 TaxID=2304604 RepID=A0A6M0SM35_9CYAN|nr:hypothetical protein [Adonisia turfae CCMR0082]
MNFRSQAVRGDLGYGSNGIEGGLIFLRLGSTGAEGGYNGDCNKAEDEDAKAVGGMAVVTVALVGALAISIT